MENITRSNIPLPEEVYNPNAGAEAFGNAFAQSLTQEIQQAKLNKIKRQEQVYGLLKEMAGSKYYEPIEPIDWNAALRNPEQELTKFKRIDPAEEQKLDLVDVPVYQQGESGVTQVIDPATGKPMTYKGKRGEKPEILSRPPLNAQSNIGLVDISTLNPTEINLAKNIIAGKASISGTSSFRDKSRAAQIVQTVADNMGVEWDENLSKIRMQTRLDYSKGKAAVARGSLNQAVGHLESLNKAFQKLGATNIPVVNKLQNWYHEQTGDSRVEAFKAAAKAVAGEMSSVFKGTTSSGTDQEIKSWEERMSAAKSPSQMKAMVDELVGLMGTRLDVLNQRWDDAFQGIPENKIQILTPTSKNILNKWGYQKYTQDYNSPEPQSYNFNSVEEAEAANLPKGTEITISGRRAVID